MSFLFDPFILIALGALVVYVCVRGLYKVRRSVLWMWALAIVALLFVWFVAISLYYEKEWFIALAHLFGYSSGRDFMINSGVFNFKYTSPTTDLIAGALFALYPLWLYIGIHCGFILFGRTEKQTGIVGLFFWERG
jgi:hypothetical protein